MKTGIISTDGSSMPLSQKQKSLFLTYHQRGLGLV
uniref:Uncharacterized protein n=1 Tax=Arundo donax TaxID=35708 RepID=A0A0A9AEN6_ARUDO